MLFKVSPGWIYRNLHNLLKCLRLFDIGLRHSNPAEEEEYDICIDKGISILFLKDVSGMPDINCRSCQSVH